MGEHWMSCFAVTREGQMMGDETTSAIFVALRDGDVDQSETFAIRFIQMLCK